MSVINKKMLKILYIRAVALLQELIQKINNFGRQRFTIMIIPHSERDIKNIHINNYKLTGVILFFSAIVLLGCFFFITFAIKAKHIDKLAFFRENSVTFLQAYIQETDELDRTIADFKKNFENFTANTALRQFRLPRHEGMGGRDLPIETIDSKLYSGEIQKLQQRQIVNRLEKDNLFIKYTGNVMKNISSFFTEREDFLKNFPSAWPVSAGHYYVFRNFRCNQNRSLTIKTMPGMTV
ncbi:MAG TPA: hypothetical protein DC049_02440, partial [Spirochaetia bacterium]|nr:hypothetical protein [Spirochaetia bacterium]